MTGSEPKETSSTDYEPPSFDALSLSFSLSLSYLHWWYYVVPGVPVEYLQSRTMDMWRDSRLTSKIHGDMKKKMTKNKNIAREETKKNIHFTLPVLPFSITPGIET